VHPVQQGGSSAFYAQISNRSPLVRPETELPHSKKGNTPGPHSRLCMTNPLRNFGSNQVVFGGMMFPVSAMLINCFMDTG